MGQRSFHWITSQLRGPREIGLEGPSPSNDTNVTRTQGTLGIPREQTPCRPGACGPPRPILRRGAVDRRDYPPQAFSQTSRLDSPVICSQPRTVGLIPVAVSVGAGRLAVHPALPTGCRCIPDGLEVRASREHPWHRPRTGPNQARRSRITEPPTSVSRKSRPLYR